MEFDKIRYDGANVELEWKEPLLGGGVRDVSDRGKDPTPALKSALQAFTGYVLWVHSLPESMADRIDVRGVTIKRPEDEPRGITVAALLRCPRARNSTSTLNTPYLCEGAGGGNSGFLPESTIEMVNALERQATLYQQGERGEQTVMPLGDSENSKEFNERAAHAEVASTRRPKLSKKEKAALAAQAEAGVPVVNADAGIPLTNDALRQLLLSVDRDVPIDAIARWTSSERESAQRWGEARQQEMVGQLDAATVPTEPACVLKDATPALSADSWMAPVPPKVSDNGAQEIAAAIERAD